MEDTWAWTDELVKEFASYYAIINKTIVRDFELSDFKKSKQMGLELLQKIRAERGIIKPKKIYRIPKISPKKAAKIKQHKENNTDEGMDKWYEERRKEMKGRCLFCNSKTEKDNDETYRRSIAHLLPKRKSMFPSIATHPDNYIELCFYANSCHTNFDNGVITWELLKDGAEWKIVVEKFKKIYPFIAENEKKNIPQILLNEISL